jgi:hypothetical protein
VTLLGLDIAVYQTGLRLEDAAAQGYRFVNLKVSHGTGLRSVMPELARWADRARSLSLGICTFHWLNDADTGLAQAAWALQQMRAIGGPDHMGHQVDCESTATEAIWRDYTRAMLDALGRPVITYSGDWWWQPRGWYGAGLTPFLWAAPSAGYLSAAYPGDTSSHWAVAYGGWRELAIMQWSVGPLASGTVNVSKSAIRHPYVWGAITGGDHLVANPDPGHAPPEAWSIDMGPADIEEVRRRLTAERETRAATILQPLDEEVAGADVRTADQ